MKERARHVSPIKAVENIRNMGGGGGERASLSKTKHKPLPYIPNVSSVNVILSHE